jgi:hypothetical protein
MAQSQPTNDIDKRFEDAVRQFAVEIYDLAFQHTLGMVRSAIRQMGERVFKGSAVPTGVTSTVQAKLPAPSAPAKIVVQCPVPGCTTPGLRTLMNFCVAHNRALPKNEKKRLREAQRKAQAQGKPAARPIEAKPVAKAATAPRATGKKAPAKPVKKQAAKAPAKGKKAPAKPAKATSKANAALLEARRIAGTKPVACPVEGCKRPGIRRFSNFCLDHHASVPASEQKALREAQRKAQEREAQAAAAG